MSDTGGGDQDDYPSKSDTIYDYTSYSYDNSANSLEIAIVSSYAPKNYGQLNDPACSIQELNFKGPIAAAFADDSDKPSSAFGTAKQQLDYAIQKFQSDLQSDPGKYSLQCFGPPTVPQATLDRPPLVPFPRNAPDGPNYPATPEDLPENGLPMALPPDAGAPVFRRGVIPPEFLMD